MERHENHHDEEHKPKKHLRFHVDCIEPTDSEFLDEFSKYTRSSWFALMFLMACMPTYCKDMVRICTTTSDDIEITCLVSPLIDKMKWNLSSIRNLTMPARGRACTYLDFNYSIFENRKPEEAYEIKKRQRTPEIKKCTVKIDGSDHSFRKYTPTFLKSCSGFDYKHEAKRFRNFFEGTSYIVCGLLGDIFGRKIVLIVCAITFAVGIIITPHVTSYYALIFGYSVEGAGVSGMVILNYIIFVEICNKNIRGILMLYLTLFGTLAKITGYTLKPHVYKVTEAYYLFAIPTCSILLYLFIMPESPRWLLSYGKKLKAWKILENWGEDLSHYVFLPEIELDKCGILRANFRILFHMLKNRKVILVMTWCKFVKKMVISNQRRYVKVANINATSHKSLILMAEIISFFSVLPPFILFGRYLTLFWMVCSCTICLLISLFIMDNEQWYMMNILSTQYLYGLDYVIILYSAELLPTSARGTGLGLILGVSEIVAASIKAMLRAWVVLRVMANFESYMMLGLQVSCIFVLIMFLPNTRVGELPDCKRYRTASAKS